MAKKYIPNKSWLTCDKGQNPTQINVTHDNNSNIYGEKLVSEADMKPGENIQPFGKCSLTKKPCMFAPVYWDKCNQGVKVNGFKLVFEDAHLLCQKGGKIKVDFSVPAGSPLDFGFTGMAFASQWANYNSTLDYLQKGVVYDVENGQLSLVRPNSASDFRRSGNYGEMKSNIFHRQNGWSDIRSEHPVINIDKPTAPGVDGIYRNGTTYKVDDAKYNTAQIQNTTNNGRELSQRWTRNHVDNGAIGNAADEAAIRQANANGTLQRTVTRTNTDGTMRNEPINDNGYRRGAGQATDIEIPQSRTQNFMNSVRSSVSSSAPVEALANSRFSQAVQASESAAKANNALWRTTQFIESSPVLRTSGKVVGRGLIVVGIAMDGASIYSAYQEEGGFGDKTQQATGSAVGGMAGAWAGGQLGAIIGTAICPGIGTVIGGVLGGVIGGIAGSSVGSKIVDWLF
jgi:hypothetical protein